MGGYLAIELARHGRAATRSAGKSPVPHEQRHSGLSPPWGVVARTTRRRALDPLAIQRGPRRRPIKQRCPSASTATRQPRPAHQNQRPPLDISGDHYPARLSLPAFVRDLVPIRRRSARNVVKHSPQWCTGSHVAALTLTECATAIIASELRTIAAVRRIVRDMAGGIPTTKSFDVLLDELNLVDADRTAHFCSNGAHESGSTG
jgi:hypothetical protein